ncbi:MAG TPA: hypothetical protein VGR89_11865, partial [Puia sp.]|nr:hypothetical protein [Puia sp.]
MLPLPTRGVRPHCLLVTLCLVLAIAAVCQAPFQSTHLSAASPGDSAGNWIIRADSIDPTHYFGVTVA